MPSRPPLPLVILLMVTQTIGWGTSISLIGVLAAPMRAELGLSSAELYGGPTVMFLVGAFVAPLAGRLSDRFGGLLVLCFGTPLLAAALLMLSQSSGLYTYLAAWLLFGLGMHLGLVTAAYNGLAQTAGAGAYRAIGILTLATGLCSTIFWPLTESLLNLLSWHQICLLYSGVTLLICTPIHMGLALAYGKTGQVEGKTSPPLSRAHVPPQVAGRAFGLLVAMQVLSASLGMAVAVLAIDIFVALGTPRETAVLAGSLLGVAYLLSRGLDVLLGARIGRMRLARLVYIALPLSIVPLLVCAVIGVPLPGWLAILWAMLFGMPAGLLGILRPSLPFHIFGSLNYGQRLGRLARPTDVANALAPAGFAWIMARSPEAVLWLGFGMALLSLAAMLLLSRLVSEGPEHKHYESLA